MISIRSGSLRVVPRATSLCNLPSWPPPLRSFASQSKSRNVVAIRLYRILQRQCQQLSRKVAASPRNQDMFLLQRPLDPREAGGSRMENIIKSSDRSIIRLFSLWVNEEYDERVEDWFEAVCSDDDDDKDYDDTYYDTQWTTVNALQKAIKYAMRRTPPDAEQQRLYQQWAIRAFQLMKDQENMHRLSSTSTERGVRVTCTSRCVGRTITPGRESSSTSQAGTKFRFAYRVRIENVSPDQTIQMLGRTWIIQDYSLDGKPVGEPVRVVAPQTGAVGKLPVLQPGQAFEYMSSCELTTMRGVMKGCFHLCRVQPDTPPAQVGMRVAAFESPDRFEVRVAPFPLEVDPDATFPSST
jgi:ApaG protein